MFSKSFLALVFPPSVMQMAKKRILRKAFPLNTGSNPTGNKHYPPGINLIGYARAEMGIGESCRIMAKSLNAVNFPFGITNFTGTNKARMTDLTWIHKEVENPQYNINVFHINAEQMIEIYAHYGNSIFKDRYNIGYWHWELPDFPDDWLESFQIVNEIWVPSTFVANSIALKSPVPVVKIPHSIEVNIPTPRSREYFHLPEKAFLFLTMYDVKSYQERKNPRASIEAFKLAFGPDDLHVGLVVKVNSSTSSPDEMQLLEELISNYNNIYLIKEILSREDTNSLIDATNGYISLHRSEGFGLGLAEAMYLGKSVIGTNWSSNTDFMNHQNSCLVDYNLIPVGRDHGPYKAYQYWANPDIEHASYFMKRLVTDIDYYKSISQKGEQMIKESFSPIAVGKTIEKRLKYLKLL
ncbi:glycosyltransferase involved in cell wall biosynthesis [Paenibacillus sp. PvR052]|nr:MULTISPECIES: glycosyltransferase [unclassified Paenibacillus]